MQRWVDAGAESVKVKGGPPRTTAEDHDRLRAVRRVLGPERRLMIDANQRWSSHEAPTAIDRLQELDLAWVEEPLDADDLEGYRNLCSRVAVPVAAGENPSRVADFEAAIAAGVAIVQPNVCRIGGITPFLRVAELARSAGARIAPHLLPEVSAQLAVALGDTCVEVPDGARFCDLGVLDHQPPITVEGASVVVHSTPGPWTSIPTTRPLRSTRRLTMTTEQPSFDETTAERLSASEYLSAPGLAADVARFLDDLSDRSAEIGHQILAAATRVVLVGSGGSGAAMLTAQYLLDRLTPVPVQVMTGKDLVWRRSAAIGPGTLVVFASFSGRTADVMEALDAVAGSGATTLAITGSADSDLARRCHHQLIYQGAAIYELPILILLALVRRDDRTAALVSARGCTTSTGLVSRTRAGPHSDHHVNSAALGSAQNCRSVSPGTRETRR